MAAILLSLVPTVVAGVGQVLAGDDVADTGPDGPSVENLTLITAQGGSPEAVASPGGVEIVDTTSKERVWAHERPDCMRYYDAEPIDNSTLFLTANCEVDGGDRLRLGIEHDWRTNTTERAFRIPWDAHDVDRLGPHRYAVADIADQQAYVYNYTADDQFRGVTFDDVPVKDSWRADHEWSWDFTERFPESDGGEEGYDEDYTHLNDVDSIYDDSAFLLSPRDFDRVIAVDRSTKEVLWTLGSQDDFQTLHGQHHPTLLETDPATVLVGDSNNHRVVEYQRVDGDWEPTWYYARGLNWPRSVDRLPSGNTLVTDTGNDRVIEVAPNQSVVWEYDTMENPYEADRYVHGNEPRGPTMASVLGDDVDTDEENATGSVTVLAEYHRIAGFVLPVWVGKWAFLGVVVAGVLTLALVGVEATRAVRRRT